MLYQCGGAIHPFTIALLLRKRLTYDIIAARRSAIDRSAPGAVMWAATASRTVLLLARADAQLCVSNAMTPTELPSRLTLIFDGT